MHDDQNLEDLILDIQSDSIEEAISRLGQFNFNIGSNGIAQLFSATMPAFEFSSEQDHKKVTQIILYTFKKGVPFEWIVAGLQKGKEVLLQKIESAVVYEHLKDILLTVFNDDQALRRINSYENAKAIIDIFDNYPQIFYLFEGRERNYRIFAHFIEYISPAYLANKKYDGASLEARKDFFDQCDVVRRFADSVPISSLSSLSEVSKKFVSSVLKEYSPTFIRCALLFFYGYVISAGSMFIKACFYKCNMLEIIEESYAPRKSRQLQPGVVDPAISQQPIAVNKKLDFKYF